MVRCRRTKVKRIWIFVFCVAILLTSCRSHVYAYDTITLPWSTSFSDCAAGEYSGCSNFAGITSGGPHCGHTCDINTGANHTGSPERGLRQWFDAGQNQNTYGLAVAFANKVNQVWVRWYERYKPGFVWNYLQYKKDLYIHDDLLTGHQSIIPEPQGNDYCVYAVNSSGQSSTKCSTSPNRGWPVIGDGNWHCMELFFDTSGRVIFWTDEVRVIDTNFGFSFSYQWGSVEFASNINDVGASCQYIDYDDLAISSTGYIRPTPPASPKGVRVN
jgi:hypothetical protein